MEYSKSKSMPLSPTQLKLRLKPPSSKNTLRSANSGAAFTCHARPPCIDRQKGENEGGRRRGRASGAQSVTNQTCPISHLCVRDICYS
eukprot:8768422-Pyramimonas_sp.AAC.1